MRVYDVRGHSTITDFIVICSGSTAPHLKALQSELQRTLKPEGVVLYRCSGKPDSGWVVLDYVDVVIHIFERESRGYYAIESLWTDLPVWDPEKTDE